MAENGRVDLASPPPDWMHHSMTCASRRFGPERSTCDCGAMTASPPLADGGLLQALLTYLDSLTITSENIGAIRHSLFKPDAWNSWVRDETAARENHPPVRPVRDRDLCDSCGSPIGPQHTTLHIIRTEH